MIDGITILNQTEITRHAYNFKLMGLFALLCIISLIACTELYNSYNTLSMIFAILFLVSFVCLLYQIYTAEEVPTSRYRYEVTIDESVRFTDIYEKYEVVEQRGEIWVLEDKETKND